MTSIIAKIGPQHFSDNIPFHIGEASDWQGKEIAMPLPKSMDREAVEFSAVHQCKTLYLWTHVNPREYPDLKGQGLCAAAMVESVAVENNQLFVQLGEVTLLSSGFTRQYLENNADMHPALNQLLEHTTSRSLYLSATQSLDFANALEVMSKTFSSRLRKRQSREYDLTLHSTYYNNGFFNLGQDVSDYVTSNPGNIDIFLGRTRQRLVGRLDRTAQSNGTPRIHGGKKLREWFQSHFKAGQSVSVTIESPSSFHIADTPVVKNDIPERPPLDRCLPADQIKSEPPNVWLTSFYGFAPEIWGFIGWTKPKQRERFIQNSQPGALMVIYGTKGDETHPDDQGKLLGIYECSHHTGHSSDFLDPVAQARLAREGRSERWRDAVQCTRAWEIAPNERLYVDDFAHLSYSKTKWREIGSQGIKLQREEAVKLLNLTVTEVPVYKGAKILDASPTTLGNALKPSQAGPNARHDYTVSVEPDGPKELYIFKLKGDVANYLGRPQTDIDDKVIIKVGLSKSPAARLKQLQANLPTGSYRWEILRSTVLDGDKAYSCHDVAVKGEDKMKIVLDEFAESLGGEFFLSDVGMILRAWVLGKNTALAAETDPNPWELETL